MLSARARLKLVRYAILATAVVVVAGALHVAAIAVVPVVAALVLTVLCWPMQQWLARFMPRWLAAGVCTGLMIIAVALVAGWAAYAIASASGEFDLSRQKYAERYRDARQWLTQRGLPESALPELNDVANGERSQGDTSTQSTDQQQASDSSTHDREPGAAAMAFGGMPSQRQERADEGAGAERLPRGSLLTLLPEESRQWLASLVTGGLRSLAGVLASVLLTIFLAYLALLEGERWIQWAHTHLSPHRQHALGDLAQHLSHLTRRYFLGKAITGIISGAATWLLLAVMGVPLAGVWGVFTFFMNFIPNIGALISGIPPTLLAVAELGIGEAAIVAVGLFLIETIVGNLLDPLLQGRFLNLSSFVVLASLVVWGWAWGIAGAILAPVLTASIYTAAQRGEQLMEREARLDRQRTNPGPPAV